jgi:hypothetical protein
VAALVVLLPTACSSNKEEPSAADLLASATKYLRAAATYTVQGRASQSDAVYTYALDVTGLDGHGAVQVGGVPVEVTKARGTYLIRGYPYLKTVSSNADYIGQDWVLWSNNDLTRLLDKLTDSTHLAATIGTARSGLKRSEDTVVDLKATKLSNDQIAVWVSADRPIRPLKVETRADHPLANGLADVKLSFSKINEPVVVEPVVAWVDPANWDTLRPFYRVQGDTYEYQSCDGSGCGIAVTVKNFGGTRGGVSFSFTFSKDGGGVLGTCGGPIPPTGNNATSRISCRIATDEWKEYYNSGTQAGYGANIKITSD